MHSTPDDLKHGIDYSTIGVMPGGIPKLLHCFWTGSPMPEVFRFLLRRFKGINPDWTVKVWSIEELPPLMNLEAFAGMGNRLAWKADVLRYELVARFPGVWADLDVTWLRPIERYIGHCSAFAGKEGGFNRWCNNSVFGAAPGHPWAWALVHRLEESYRKHKEEGGVSYQVGVPYFNRILADYTNCVTQFHKTVFNPFHDQDLRNADLIDHPIACGIHWYNSANLRGKVEQAIQIGRLKDFSVG